MEEGLYFFRAHRQVPTLTLSQLLDFVNARGVECSSLSSFVAHFDVMCHVDGFLYYRMRLETTIPPKHCNTFKDFGGSFVRRDHFPNVPGARYGDNELVHVMETHTFFSNPHNVLIDAHCITLDQFRRVVAKHVRNNSLEQQIKW